jgi:hypothetical protein
MKGYPVNRILIKEPAEETECADILMNSIGALIAKTVQVPGLDGSWEISHYRLNKYIHHSLVRPHVGIQEELCFLHEYFNLLHIFCEDDHRLQIDYGTFKERLIRIKPCILLLIVENIVKKNEFFSPGPLDVQLSFRDDRIEIKFRSNQKWFGFQMDTESINRVNELSYGLTGKEIKIRSGRSYFMVDLPVLLNPTATDLS